MTTSVPPIIRTQDNLFWFDGAAAGRLLVQRCAACGHLRHPPAPACPVCRSFEWDAVESALRGRLHSWTVVHHPPDESLTYPLAIGLVDLELGTRLVADFEEGTDLAALAIGREIEITFGPHAHGVILPRLRILAAGGIA